MTMRNIRQRLDRLEMRVSEGAKYHVIRVPGVHPVGTPDDAPELIAAQEQARAAYEADHGPIAESDTVLFLITVNAPRESQAPDGNAHRTATDRAGDTNGTGGDTHPTRNSTAVRADKSRIRP